ncbi:MAG: hypothetical protein L3J59_04345 [Methylococcaceae bacterium]|nr:hypothetical protein [Methylococcaceae bacterium]
MLKNIWTTIFLLTVVIYQKPANALDLRVQPRFKTGIQFYEFEQPSFQSPAQDPEGKFPNIQSSVKYSDWLPFVSGGTTLFIDRLFIDVDVQYLFGGQDDSDFSSQNFVKSGGALQTDAVLQNKNSRLTADFDRFEWAISAGFEVFDNLVLFGGYKYAKTSVTSNILGTIESFQPSNGQPIPFLTGTTLGEVDIEFEYDGPFVGMNYNWRIQQGFMNGGLSFNFAAAFLDSTSQIDLSKVAVKSATGQVIPLNFQNNDGQGRNQFTELKGDSIGYSFGLGWQGITPVKGLTYLMGVTGYLYQFDHIEGKDTVENRIRLDFGLSYAFDF